MTCNLEKNKGVSVKSLPLGGEGASLQFITLAGSEPGQLAEHAELLQKAEKSGLRWIGPEVYGSADLDLSPVPGAGMKNRTALCFCWGFGFVLPRFARCGRFGWVRASCLGATLAPWSVFLRSAVVVTPLCRLRRHLPLKGGDHSRRRPRSISPHEGEMADRPEGGMQKGHDPSQRDQSTHFTLVMSLA